VVQDGDSTVGILTDRDITLRAIADGRDPSRTRVGEICTSDPTTLNPEDGVGDAIELMREKDVRRLPVVDGGGAPVGILSIGDLAIERDRESVLADISAAAPNN
jgi:CBS domain-containing protein